MPTKKKKYQIVLEVTHANGTQTFEVEAGSREEAEQLFREGKSEIVESDLEAEGLEDIEYFNFSEMYEA